MIKAIIISVIISITLNSAITIFAMRIMNDFLTRFLVQTEKRFDKKLGIYKQLKQHDISKWVSKTG